MLEITIPAVELFDESTNTFVNTKEQTLRLEHSLVSLRKWESKWKKAFLGKQEKTFEETIDYIKCMTLTQNVDPKVYNYLTEENLSTIFKYIEDPMTASHIRENPNANNGKGNSDTPTAEVIHYWMISFNIPSEYQKWHLNQLLALIRVCNVKNNPPKPMSRKELMNRNKALNAERRKQMRSRG